MTNTSYGLDIDWEVKTLKNLDGQTLRYASYYRGAGSPDYYFVFLNGRCEYIEKYSYLAQDLDLGEKGAFLTWDHRGQGASEGLEAHVQSFDDFAKDASLIIESEVGAKPYVAMGHSMGGLIALYSSLKKNITPRGLVLASPLIGLPNDPLPTYITKPLCSFLQKVGLGKTRWFENRSDYEVFEGNKLTHSQDRFKNLGQSPYHTKGPTFDWGVAAYKAVDFINDSSQFNNLPAELMVLISEVEKVVDLESIHSWCKHARSKGVKLEEKVIPHTKHEIFSEEGKAYELALKALNSLIARQLFTRTLH